MDQINLKSEVNFQGLELAFKKYLFRLVLLFMAPVLSFYIVNAIAADRLALGAILALMLAVLIAAFIFAARTRNKDRERQIYLLSLMLFAVLAGLVSLYVIGFEGKTDLLSWTYLFPVLFIFAFGLRKGLLGASVFAGTVLLVIYVFSPPEMSMLKDFIPCYLIPFALLTSVLVLLEHVRRRTQQSLFIKQAALADSENHLRQANEQLTREIQDHRHSQQTLETRLAMEHIIATISSNFVNLAPDQIDRAVEESLRMIGRFARVDRCYVFRRTQDGAHLDNTHEWCAPGVAPQKHNLQRMPLSRKPWATKKLQRLEVVHVPRVADMPPEAGPEKELFEGQGIQSLLNVPMGCPGSLRAFIGFDSVNQEKTWAEEDIALLRTVGEIFDNAWARQKAEEALRESERRFREMADLLPIAIAEIKPDLRVYYANELGLTSFGLSQIDINNGLSIKEVIRPDYHEQMAARAQRVLGGEILGPTEYVMLRKDGSEFVALVNAAPIWRHGEIIGLRATVQDITQRKKAEQEIQYLAYHDVLTGLPNRQSFYERLEDSMIQSQRRARHNLLWALLFLDLDRFKGINDALGHEAGDHVLSEVASRIQGIIRESDRFFRLGGDEFTIMLTNLAEDIDAAKVAEKILTAVSRPVRFRDHELHLTASIGISVYPHDGQEVESIIRHADMAMYAAKEDGNRYRFFTEAINKKALERIKMESSLRGAVEQGQMEVYYQPLVNAERRIVGVEALLRWRHPELGLVMPGKFIDLAEETGLIVPLGEWVLRCACQQAKTWQDLGYEELYVAVNLSARQFRQRNLVEAVQRSLKDAGLKPECLHLEVTESGVMDDPEEAILKMKKLRDLGVHFSIDDFGVGHSSLSYLKRFPTDTSLKIDRFFVREAATSHDDQEIIKAIVSMARRLGMEPVAEGVETKEQEDFLSAQGCDMMQGFYFSPPMPAAEFEALMIKNPAPSPHRNAPT